MLVCLLDIDSKIPNVALMKLSTYHRRMGDAVKLGFDPGTDRPDLAYASKMFDFTSEPDIMPDCEIVKGGPGYDASARLGIPEYERIMPDYSLYPQYDYAIGRFTRGCPNNCPWCVVPAMDGNEVRHVADLCDFWDGQKVVRLLDDNIMADADEFCRACDQLAWAGVKTIWEALDIRLVNEQTAKALASIGHAKRIHFSWDGPSQDDGCTEGYRAACEAWAQAVAARVLRARRVQHNSRVRHAPHHRTEKNGSKPVRDAVRPARPVPAPPCEMVQ